MGKPRYEFVRGAKGKFIPRSFSNNSANVTGSMNRTMVSNSKKGKKYRKKTYIRPANYIPRIGKKSSVVWYYFKQNSYEHGLSRATCVICGAAFKNPGGSTTGMRSHLDRDHVGCVDLVLRTQGDQQKTEVAKEYIANHASIRVEPDFKLEIENAHSPPPPPLSIELELEENGAIGEVGQTEIFQDDDMESENEEQSLMMMNHITTTSEATSRNFPGPPEVLSVNGGCDEENTKLIVDYLIRNLKPLETVNELGFKKMVYGTYSMLTEDNSVPTVVIDTLNCLYTENREDVKGELEEKYISISLELWVKTNSEIYMMATANFISGEWCLESKFMGMAQLPGTNLMTPMSEINEKISHALNGLIDDLNINRKKLSTITFNAFPFKQEGPSVISSIAAIPCFNVVIQQTHNILKEFSKEFSTCDVTKDCHKFASLVLPSYKEIRSNPGKLLEAFKDLVVTGSGGNLPLTATIEQIEALVKMQEPINDMIDSLMDVPRLPASNLLTLIFGLPELYYPHLEVVDSTWTLEQKRQVTDRITSYLQSAYNIDTNARDIGDKTLAICFFLDPRCKDLLRFFSDEQRQIVYDAILALMYQIEKEQNQSGFDTGSIIKVSSQNPNYKPVINGSCDPLDISTPTPSTSFQASKFSTFFTTVMRRKEVLPTCPKVQEEMTKYFQEPAGQITLDPYQWWSYNCETYPILGELAKRYLCIRGVSIPTKYAFTSAGKEYYNRLANVEPDYLEMLLCLHKNVAAETDALSETTSSHNIKIDQRSIKSEDFHQNLMDEEI